MTQLKSGKRVPVSIPEELLESYRSYSQATGVPVSRSVADALREYKLVLDVRLEVLAERATGKAVILPFPSPLPLPDAGVFAATGAEPLLKH